MITTVRLLEVVYDVGEKLTVGRNIRPGLSNEQHSRIDTFAWHVTPSRPVDRYWRALKKVGEEETDGPKKVDPYQTPHRILDPSTLEYAIRLLA